MSCNELSLFAARCGATIRTIGPGGNPDSHTYEWNAVVDVVTAIAAVVGAILSVLVFWRDLGDWRARRYHERFKALGEMAETVRADGPYAGRAATEKAEEAHSALVASFDVERRATSVMYLKAAGRLQRPGSMFVAFGLIAYAALLIALLVPDVLDASVPAADAEAVVSPITKWLLLLIAVGVFVRGVIEGARRWESRQIRLALGHSDDLTRAAATKYAEGIMEMARSRARANAQKPEEII
jgi:hypothetical protein